MVMKEPYLKYVTGWWYNYPSEKYESCFTSCDPHHDISGRIFTWTYLEYILAFYLTYILAFYLAFYMAFYLAFYLAFFLAFYF